MIDENRLRAARALRGITQRRLGDMIGLKEIEVSRIETGRALPDPETKRRISVALQKPTFEIFDH